MHDGAVERPHSSAEPSASPTRPAQVETFDNRLCSDLLLILQPINEDGSNLCLEARSTLWSTHLYPAASFLLALYSAALHRVASIAWSMVGAPMQARASIAYQAGLKLLQFGPRAAKQAPATKVHVSSAVLASSSHKLASMLLPRMAHAASRVPAPRAASAEGQRTPLQITLRIPAAQLPATFAVLRYPYRPNSLVLEPHTDPLLVLNTALVAHTLGVTRLRDMCTAWLCQQPMTWQLAHTLLAMQVRSDSASLRQCMTHPDDADSALDGKKARVNVPLRPAVGRSSLLVGRDMLFQWVKGPASPANASPYPAAPAVQPRPLASADTEAAASANSTAPGSDGVDCATLQRAAVRAGSVVDVSTTLGLREDVQIQALVEMAKEFALLGFQNLEQIFGDAHARSMLEDLPYEVLLCLITDKQLQVATENTVALAVISWIHAGYLRIPSPSLTNTMFCRAATEKHEQHSLLLLAQVRFPFLTSSYLVHILPVLMNGLGPSVRDALAKYREEAFLYNSSMPEKKSALAGEVLHSRFTPRPMYLQPPHDHLSLRLQLDLSSLSKTWLPAVSAVSPYLRSLVLSTPACHTTSEDKYYNGFFWRLSVAADEFVGLSWYLMLRGHELPLPENAPKVMVHAGVHASGETAQTKDAAPKRASAAAGHHHRSSHPNASKHDASPLVKHATVTAVHTALAEMIPHPDPASDNIAPAGANEDVATFGRASTSGPIGPERTSPTFSRSSSLAESSASMVTGDGKSAHRTSLVNTSSGRGVSLTGGQVREFHGLLPPHSMGGFGSHSDGEVCSTDGVNVAGRDWIGLVSKLGHLVGLDINAGEHSGMTVTLQCTIYSCD